VLRIRPPEPPTTTAAAGPPARRRPAPPDRWAAPVATLVLTAGVVLRFATTSSLWIDEALTVHIARLPLPDLFEALRHDGSPPLFYLLLHAWMNLFGQGDVAVRALPGLLAVATLPLAFALGRRIDGRRGGWAAALVVASSPFVVRYATEARPYGLEVLLVVAGALAVARALERPAAGRLAVVAAATGALLLTHYWSFYLVAVAGLVVLSRLRDPAARPAALRVALAMAAGGLAFLPWLPAFLFQAEHTGTPWAARPAPVKVWFAVREWGGGDAPGEVALALALLAAAGVAARRAPALAVTVAGTLVVALIACRAAPAAYVPRYTSVVVGLALVLAGVGAARIGRPALAAVVAGGLVISILGVDDQRTQAPEIADAIVAAGEPGDIVVYCPDQLGPATTRLLPDGFDERTYPTGASPELVDWVDYRERNRAAEPWDFAQGVLADAGDDRRIFLVWAGQYRTFARDCQRLVYAFRGTRAEERLVRRDRDRYYEPMWLDVFSPA
jgi:hypothetical protein